MPGPLVVTIEHGSTKAEMRQRLERRLDRVRAEVAPYVSSLESEWRGDAVDFRLAALGQTVTGTIAVEERVLRITLLLPLLLSFLGDRIGSRIRERGLKLLGPQ